MSDPPPPSGNLADLLTGLGGTNTNGVNVYSSLLGALADSAGAGQALQVFYKKLQDFLNGHQPDPLQTILDTLQNDFDRLFAALRARWNEEDWRNLAQLVSGAETVLLDLDGLLNAQPPLTEKDRLDHIATCEAPLVTLSDPGSHFPSPFFLVPYSEQVYFQDAYYGRQAPPTPADNQVFSYLYVLLIT